MLWPYYWQSVRASAAGTGGPGGGGILVYDTYTDANGTAIASHTPDVRPGSNAWEALVGTWQIQSNRGKLTASGGGGQNTAAIDAGVANVTAQVDLVTDAGGGTDSGLIVNVGDANNYWLMAVGADGAITLYQRVAGAFTARDNDTYTYVAGNTYVLKIVTAGDTISGYVDNVLKVTYTTAGRALKTNTKAGIRTFQTDTGSLFDNFRVTA